MVKFEVSGVTFELVEGGVCAEVLSVLESAEKHIEWLKSHSYEDRNKDGYNWRVLDDLVDKSFYYEEYEPFHDALYTADRIISHLEDDLYREYAMDDFLEYQSHMDEPDFDWDFYSDWHKDIYGFRPH